MVDVREVITADPFGVVNLDGKVTFAPLWFACHRRLDNLVLRQEFNEILNSQKFTWRMMAEMLLELEAEGRPEWAKLEWIVFDLKSHSVAKLVVPEDCVGPLSFEVNGNDIQPGKYLYGWTKSGAPGAYSCSASDEHVFNQTMMKLFGKKFPFRLKSMTPVRGNVTVSVPVEAKKGSKLDELYRKMGS